MPSKRLKFFFLFFFPYSVHAADGFLAGYTTALLEGAFPDPKVEVHGVSPEGAVWLRGDDCLEEAQRDLIEASLLKTPRIRQVQWQLPCTERIVPAAYRLRIRQDAVEVLPTEQAFKPLVADPREARFGIRFQHHQLAGDSFFAADVALGGYLGLASGGRRQQEWELGIQGGVFALFNLDEDSRDLVNTDYWIGLPLSFRRDAWSFRTRFYHQSSHLGDEYILRYRPQRRNISYEALDFMAAHQWDQLRIFGGGGYVVHSVQDQDPWQVMYGAEYRRPKTLGRLNLLLASFFKHTEDQSWSLKQSYRLGLTMGRGEREIGVLLAYYSGNSPDGQFYEADLEYAGLELFFRL